MKKYCLYLDESGDFNYDLDKKNSNECVVGGILLEKQYVNDKIPERILVEAWREWVPEDKRLSNEELLRKCNHATELEGSVKANLMHTVLKNTSKEKMDFVIFENFSKTKIIDSTLTYINIMVEGIFQLLQYLINRDNDLIELNVIAGFKKDCRFPVTNSPIEGYIDIDEYKTHINEKLVLMKAKKMSYLPPETKIKFELQNDKSNKYLILSDYICNFRFKRNASIYNLQNSKEELCLREKMEHLYKQEFIFNFIEKEEDGIVSKYIYEGMYSTALFDLCNGSFNMKNRKIILDNCARLPRKMLDNYFQGLTEMIDNIIGIQREIIIGERILREADSIITYLEECGASVIRFRIDVMLYKLAIMNHKGDLKNMRIVFDELTPYINKFTSRTENLEYYFMFYNRLAQYCIDTYDFDKALEILDNMEKVYENCQLIMMELPYYAIDEVDIRSDQLGKIYGTKCQCIRYLMSQRRYDYNLAREVSEKAIKNLIYPNDIHRQYQYRAQIEKEAGHYKEALQWITKSLENKDWKLILSNDIKHSSFLLYHLTSILRDIAQSDEEENKVIAKELLEECLKYQDHYFDMQSFPEVIVCANIAYVLSTKEDRIKQAYKYYKASICNCLKIDSDILNGLALAVNADLIRMLIDEKSPLLEEEIDKMRSRYSEFMKRELAESTRSYFAGWDVLFEKTDGTLYSEYARKRQY